MKPLFVMAAAAIMTASVSFAQEGRSGTIVAFDVSFYMVEAPVFRARFFGADGTARAVLPPSEVQAFTSLMLEARKIAARDASGPPGRKLAFSAIAHSKYVMDIDLNHDGVSMSAEPIEGTLQTGFGGEITPVSITGGSIVSTIKMQAAALLEQGSIEHGGGKIDLPSIAAIRLETTASIPAGGLCLIGFAAPQKPETMYLIAVAARLESGDARGEIEAPPTLGACAWLIEHSRTELARFKPKSSVRELDAESAAKARDTGKVRGMLFFPFVPGMPALVNAGGQESYPRAVEREEIAGVSMLDVIIGRTSHAFELTLEKPHPDTLPADAPLNAKASVLLLPVKTSPVKGAAFSLLQPHLVNSSIMGIVKALPASKTCLFEMLDSKKKYAATLLVSVGP